MTSEIKPTFSTNSFVSDKEKKSCFVKVLVTDILYHIFSYLNLCQLTTVCLTSKRWHIIASTKLLWKQAIYRELAFSQAKWIEHFGKEQIQELEEKEEINSLPLEKIIETYDYFHATISQKSVKETLVLVKTPKLYVGQLTLEVLRDWAKKYFSEEDKLFTNLWGDIIDLLKDETLTQSSWIIMTTDVLLESRHQSYEQQKELIAKLKLKQFSDYDMPTVLEAVICMLAQFFISSKKLFGNQEHELTYTRCQHSVYLKKVCHPTCYRTDQLYPLVVGRRQIGSFDVGPNNCDSLAIGIALVKKLGK